MKHHQKMGEIRIIFPPTSSKGCLKKKKQLSCKIHPWHITQSSSHSIRLRSCYKCFTQYTFVSNRTLQTEKQLFWFQYSAGKKKVSSCCWWDFLTAASAIVCVHVPILSTAAAFIMLHQLNYAYHTIQVFTNIKLYFNSKIYMDNRKTWTCIWYQNL